MSVLEKLFSNLRKENNKLKYIITVFEIIESFETIVKKRLLRRNILRNRNNLKNFKWFSQILKFKSAMKKSRLITKVIIFFHRQENFRSHKKTTKKVQFREVRRKM